MEEKMEERRQRLAKINKIWLIACAVLCVAMLVAANQSLGNRGLQNALRSAESIALFAVAMALPYSLGYCDVSQTGVAALAGALLTVLITEAEMPTAGALLLVLLAGVAAGAVNGLIAVFVCRGRALLTLAASFAIGSAGKAIAWLVVEETVPMVPGEGLAELFSSPLGALLLLALALLAAVPFAVSGGRKASPAKGVAAYAVSGLLSVLAAAAIIWRYSSGPSGTYGTYSPSTFNGFSLTPEIVLVLAIAGVGVAFAGGRRGANRVLGFVRVLLAALTVESLNLIARISPTASYYSIAAWEAALLLIFVVLNAVLGAQEDAAAQEDEPEEETNEATAPNYGKGATGGIIVGTKSKVVAALLAFFLGGTGAHRYYLGYKKEGGVQTAGFVSAIIGYSVYISAVTESIYGRSSGGGTMALAAFFLILGCITGIWAFVDFIRILTGGLTPADGAAYTENRPVQVVQVVQPEPSTQDTQAPRRFQTTPPSRQNARPAPQQTVVQPEPPQETQGQRFQTTPPSRQSEHPAPSAPPQTETVQSAAAEAPSTDRNMEILEKLAALHAQGILTDEEFQKKKKDILDKI